MRVWERGGLPTAMEVSAQEAITVLVASCTVAVVVGGEVGAVGEDVDWSWRDRADTEDPPDAARLPAAHDAAVSLHVDRVGTMNDVASSMIRVVEINNVLDRGERCSRMGTDSSFAV